MSGGNGDLLASCILEGVSAAFKFWLPEGCDAVAVVERDDVMPGTTREERDSAQRQKKKLFHDRKDLVVGLVMAQGAVEFKHLPKKQKGRVFTRPPAMRTTHQIFPQTVAGYNNHHLMRRRRLTPSQHTRNTAFVHHYDDTTIPEAVSPASHQYWLHAVKKHAILTCLFKACYSKYPDF